jgi:predicted ABC-type ATPase
MPNLYIIAGCNGAGKTTAAYDLLPNVFNAVEFINADEIAKGLSPFNPTGAAVQAGRIMLARMEQMIDKSESFAFETTLAGVTYLKFLNRAKDQGYGISLFFVYLSSVRLAIERVELRISKGGHAIPKNVIERRYYKGLANLFRYIYKVDDWFIYDNSGKSFDLIASGSSQTEEIVNFELFRKIKDNEH